MGDVQVANCDKIVTSQDHFLLSLILIQNFTTWKSRIVRKIAIATEKNRKEVVA